MSIQKPLYQLDLAKSETLKGSTVNSITSVILLLFIHSVYISRIIKMPVITIQVNHKV